MKPSVPLVVSVGLLVVDPSPTAAALLAVVGIQLGTVAIYRLSQVVVHRGSLANARALVLAMRGDETSQTVTIGANGEVRVVRRPVETAADFVGSG